MHSRGAAATAWTCHAECSSAPLRIGPTCEVECLSVDGVNCLRPNSCAVAAANASNMPHIQPVVCGNALKATWGTNGV